ncbi:MAG TPA: PEP/pyruvate-binding domain-containing protein [Microbacteriaceae bacterium]|nr:PEP/pyruvate-binding domain-containing protein [Microbacteriaceae bacterium]
MEPTFGTGVKSTGVKTGPLVVDLAEVGKDDIGLVGGKGANLGELTLAHFPVPTGFVVTTNAYRVAIETAGLSDGIAARAHADARALRDEIAQLRLPEQLRAAITEAYDCVGGTVAVRSSATAEDLPGAAFAGQQDSYLGILGADAVLGAVRDCWASLWNDRAIAYRRRLQLDGDDVAIAVVVQTMVHADAAGVLFTADPVTGARDRMVIDASAGLGESVVSGLVTPDHYVIDRDGAVLNWSPGNRETIILSNDAGGTSQTHGKASADPLLQVDVLRRLAELGRAVEDHFGSQQDIEWAQAGGEVQLVQARPMTALPTPQKLNRIQRLLGSVFSDYFSVRPYPLDVTTWLPYGPVGLMERVIASVGIHTNFGTMLPEEDGVVVRFVPPTPTPGWRVLAAPFSVLSRARRYNPVRWRDDPHFVEFDRTRRALTAHDLPAATWQQLMSDIRAALRLVEPVTALRTNYLPAMGLSLLRLRLALARLGRIDLMADLIVGARTVTTEGNERLTALADSVRSDELLAELFAADDADATLRAIHHDPGFAWFAAEFDAYLTEFGHRETTSPVLVSPPTWADAPQIVIGLIAMLAAEHDERAELDRSADAEADLMQHRRLASPDARRKMLKRVNAARAGIAFREDSHDAFTRVMPLLRRVLLEVGRRLTAAGALIEAEDVFHLRLAEIEAIRDVTKLGQTDAARLSALVRARSLKREQLAAMAMVDYAAIFGRRVRQANALVTGTPACAGRATGTVRVISGPAEFGMLKPGEVLVCPYTNPSWTPLFQRASAVVVDTGGIGSHAAIVARENGIPAVMGTGDGTRVLSTGQRVTVDGTSGLVTAA